MKNVRTLWILIFALMLGVRPPAAHAEITTYEKPALMSIVKALIRFGAIDIYDDDMIDVYARTNECELFKKHYKDVFKWEKIRGALREVVRQDVVTYPTGFRYETGLTLDRYDFKRGIYPFHDVTRYQGVNTFTMQASAGDLCVEQGAKRFPTIYKMVVDKTLTLDGLPLNEAEGEALFNRMEAANNKEHIVYVNFNIRMIYVAALPTAREIAERATKLTVNKVQQNAQSESVVIDSRLDTIEYFEDPERTKLIYIYRP